MTRWAAEDGWPYPDPLGDLEELGGETDDDLLSVRTDTHLFDTLNGLEREVVSARFGLAGHEFRSMKQLCADLGLPRHEVKVALGSGLDKIRSHLST